MGRLKKTSEKGSEEVDKYSSTSFTLVSQIMGAALLSIAYIFARIGYVLSFILMPFTLAVALYLALALIEACYLTRSFTFRELVANVIGRKFSYFVDSLLILSNFGFLTGYVIIVSQAIVGVVDAFVPRDATGHPDLGWVKYVVTVCIPTFIMFPLSLLTSIKTLGAIASVSIFFAFATALTVPTYFFISLARKGQVCPRLSTDIAADQGYFRQGVPIWPSSSKGLNLGQTAMGFIFFFSYIPMLQSNIATQNPIPAMLGSMRGPLYIRMRVLRFSVICSLCISTVLYIIVGAFGSALFGEKIEPNILSSFSICKDYWLSIVNILYALVLCVAYPLVEYPNKLSILGYTNINRELQPKKWYGVYAGVTAAFLVGNVAIALAYDNIASIFGLLGAISGSFVYFIVPIWVAYKLPEIRVENIPDIAEEFQDAADHNGIVETEAVGTSIMAMFLPGPVGSALARARSMSTTAPLEVNQLEVVETKAGARMRANSLIGFTRGRTLSSVMVPPSTSLEPGMVPPTIDLPEQPAGGRRNSFVVSVVPATTAPGRRLSLTQSRGSSKAFSPESPRRRRQSGTSIRNSQTNARDEAGEGGIVVPDDEDTVPTEGSDEPIEANEEKLVSDVPPQVPESRFKQVDGPGIGVVPAVAECQEAQQVEIAELCGPELNVQKEMEKMTACRKATVWSIIVIVTLVCIESFIINVLDFAGRVD
ncbi:Amino acid transporter family [Giardia muris]|uniref:Amino acid transporter family n=1 Tax=Giardia muris TaxID=5742 RepID=A0A4Z1T8J8_GIAMU|nr:Amino acid transporter family [Giardia muris]|eukprot:TNJ28841.1 Amino acid transporter family [Giardia muris]